MAKKFRTPYDTSNHQTQHELNNQPSKTVPDQSMSIPELIRRYASGLPLGGSKVPQYLSEEENELLNGRNWESLDLSEKHDLLKYAADEIKHINKKLNKPKPPQPQGEEQQA